MTDMLDQLVNLSKNLGLPANDYVILGEGNTSAKIDDQSFWVKKSGVELATIDADGFARVRFEPMLEMLTGPELSDDEITQALFAAKVDPQSPGKPSVETAFHAACLQLPDVNFVAHTHPTAINMLTCSVAFEAATTGRLFPDEIVICGVAPLLIPYIDPGLPLAREIYRRLYQYIDERGERPKIILMQNHGLIVLAPTAQQAQNITAMAVKAARILQGTYAFGGPHFLTPADVNRIHTRPDEHYRQKIIGKG
ncbi:MAG: Methylthioribulose-1-phosphate dehydratase [Anaerolineae bacterium]|nr:Methylthioribulose-1-phosphate dehydratase [Anaerolineae bacterium]